VKLSIETAHVLDDLKVLQAFDINAYGRVAALLRELNANQGTPMGQVLLDGLNIQGLTQNINPQVVCNCLRIENERIERDLWRLKLWRINATTGKQVLEPYRIIYGFFAASQFRKIPEVRFFAVPCRAREKDDSYDYKPDHPIAIRVRSDFDNYL
jgi:hypothetical protein